MQADSELSSRQNTRHRGSASVVARAAVGLTIAGSDSSGGAGIQADLKTLSALGVYGASVITAVTAQNTCAVTAVHDIPADIVSAQLRAVFDDLPIGSVKIGMLSSPATIQAVAEQLQPWSGRVPLVLDPVMIAKSGATLLPDEAIETLRRKLLPLATVLTPNLPEAACLLQTDSASSVDSMEAQGMALLALGPEAVLMKGGHADGADCVDLLLQRAAATIRFAAPRIDTRNTHGTGCTLSAAIAAGLAKGLDLAAAVAQAHDYLQGAIGAADELNVGAGHGPVHHFHKQWRRPQ